MSQKGSSVCSAPVTAPGAGASVECWLNWLEAIHPSEIELGLDRVMLVFRRLFPRKPDARIITVAGTNGKGSTVATLETLLLASGRTTGAYTSPHLQSYNERVRLNGSDIDDSALVRAFEAVEAARGSVPLTYFEFGTLAAFVALAQADVQDWLLEVGLGGRLDAVNVLDAHYAVITAIDIDHIGFLGDDREGIGFEKAGILRPGITAVCADPEPPASVLQQARAQKVALSVSGRDYTLQPTNSGDAVMLAHENRSVRLPGGPLPVESVAAATVLFRHLQPGFSEASIEASLADVNLAGRFETLKDAPWVIADVGHNPHAAAWLASRLMATRTDKQTVHAVYAALSDKDVVGVARAMQPAVDRWYLAGLDVPRGLAADALCEKITEAGVSGDRFATMADALFQAIAEAAEDDIIVVFGSFFTVAQARALC